MKRMAILLIAVVFGSVLTGCGRRPDAESSQRPLDGQRVSTVRSFTPSDRLSPPGSDMQARVSADDAYAEVIRLGWDSTGSRRGPHEALLGLFEHEPGGPRGVLAWAFVLLDVPLAAGDPRIAANSDRTQVQTGDLVVVVDAASGQYLMAIGGASRS